MGTKVAQPKARALHGDHDDCSLQARKATLQVQFMAHTLRLEKIMHGSGSSSSLLSCVPHAIEWWS